MSRPTTAGDLGYIHTDWKRLVQSGDGYDLIPINFEIKAGDEYASESGWKIIPDKYIGIIIASNFQPIRRRKKWICGHGRDDNDEHCRVCIVFFRYITEVA